MHICLVIHDVSLVFERARTRRPAIPEGMATQDAAWNEFMATFLLLSAVFVLCTTRLGEYYLLKQPLVAAAVRWISVYYGATGEYKRRSMSIIRAVHTNANAKSCAFYGGQLSLLETKFISKEFLAFCSCFSVALLYFTICALLLFLLLSVCLFFLFV